MKTTIRSVNGIEYRYQTKAVKNLNLHVTAQGQVWVSAPRGLDARRADAFVASRAGWIAQARQRALERARQDALPPPDPRQALALFTQVSEEIFPLFATVLGGQRPRLLVRDMKTRWGSCSPGRRQITLNLRLAAKPRPLVEYVVLHEYCHFIHPNHQAGFWALMESLMPDCRARRRALRLGDGEEKGAKPGPEPRKG